MNNWQPGTIVVGPDSIAHYRSNGNYLYTCLLKNNEILHIFIKFFNTSVYDCTDVELNHYELYSEVLSE